jgi:hypothetical protein
MKKSNISRFGVNKQEIKFQVDVHVVIKLFGPI